MEWNDLFKTGCVNQLYFLIYLDERFIFKIGFEWPRNIHRVEACFWVVRFVTTFNGFYQSRMRGENMENYFGSNPYYIAQLFWDNGKGASLSLPT